MSTVANRAARTGLLGLAPLALVAVMLGVLPLPPALLLVALVGGTAAVVASRHPVGALLAFTAVAVLVPYYYGRYVVGAVGLSPLAAGCLVLLPAALIAARQVRLGRLDLAVGALVLLRCAASLVNAEGPLGAVLNVLLTTALPYAVFRCLTLRPQLPRQLAAVVVVSAAPLAAVGLAERSGNGNPFFTLLRPELEAAQWARPELRSGGVRAEASFGHPIPFGMFLALALVLAVVLILTVEGLLLRAALLGTCGLLLLALTATLSRGPLLVAAVGITAWSLLNVFRVDVLRLAGAAGVLAVVAVTTPVLGTLESLQRSSTGDTAEARSAEYRLQVLEAVRDPDQFSLLGLPATGGSVTEAVSRRTGLKSIDSELAVVHLTSGALALGAMLVVGALLVVSAARPGLTTVESAWAITVAVSFLNLTTVALLTQYEELFWAFTALVAAITQRQAAQEQVT